MEIDTKQLTKATNQLFQRMPMLLVPSSETLLGELSKAEADAIRTRAVILELAARRQVVKLEKYFLKEYHYQRVHTRIKRVVALADLVDSHEAGEAAKVREACAFWQEKDIWSLLQMQSGTGRPKEIIELKETYFHSPEKIMNLWRHYWEPVKETLTTLHRQRNQARFAEGRFAAKKDFVGYVRGGNLKNFRAGDLVDNWTVGYSCSNGELDTDRFIELEDDQLVVKTSGKCGCSVVVNVKELQEQVKARKKS